jgi:hypothetical protein
MLKEVHLRTSTYPQGLKPIEIIEFTAGLKSRPFKANIFSAAPKGASFKSKFQGNI